MIYVLGLDEYNYYWSFCIVRKEANTSLVYLTAGHCRPAILGGGQLREIGK